MCGAHCLVNVANFFMILFLFLDRVSELRVVELLDGLCDKMQDYTLQKVIIG